MKRNQFLLSAAGGAAAALVPSPARAQMHFQQPLTIAVNAALSGNSAAGGNQIAFGVQSAIDEVNQTGGTFGTAFAMRTFDDMDALAQSIVNVQFAASDSTIIAAIAGFDGNVIAATLPTYANQQMAVMVPGSTADAVTAQPYRNVFRLPTKDSTEGRLASAYLASTQKPALAIAITQDGDYGPDVAQGFLDQARSAKLNWLEYAFPAEKPDFTAAARALAAKNADHIYLCGSTAAMGPLIPALRAAGYKGRFSAGQGFYNEQTLKAYANEFEGGFISTSFPPLERAPDAANTLADFRSRGAVTALSAFGYAAAQIVMQAVRRSGVTNRLAALAALQSPVPYNTIVGPFQFTYNGDPIDPIVYFYTTSNGSFKYVAPSHATPFVL